MPHPVSQTARLTAAARARESERHDRLFHDPFAECLATQAGFALLEAMRRGRENPYIVVRTCYFDGFLCAATGQVVLVAAGLDARAWRLRWAPGVELYEIDHPDVFDEKARCIGGEAAPCQRREVGADLEGAWMAALIESGFDVTRPATWLVEGLLMYLDDTFVTRLLDQISACSAPGSRLAVDAPSRTFLDESRTEPWRHELAKIGAPWQFGTDEPERLLSERGWEQVKVVRPGDPAAACARWPGPASPATPFAFVSGVRAPLHQPQGP